MSIRQIQVSATVATPGDPYLTPVMFSAGQLVDVAPGGPWETAIGAGNCPVLSGTVLASDQTGSGGSVSN
jgi:hypothetical protein